MIAAAPEESVFEIGVQLSPSSTAVTIDVNIYTKGSGAGEATAEDDTLEVHSGHLVTAWHYCGSS